MTIFLPRSAWTNHGPAHALTPLQPGPLRGFAIHWPGDSEPHIDAANQGHIAALLEGERRFHVETRGWSDIAYQAAVDLEGRVWDLRSERFQSAANGNQAVNKSHGAITLLLGTQDTPSPAMIQAVRDWRRKRWLALWPKATRVVGHRDLFGTDCPGSAAYALVKNGTFTRDAPPPKPPDIPIHILHLMHLRDTGKATKAQLAELDAWEHHRPWPPAPPPPAPKPKPVRTPLMTDYVFGLGQDIPACTAVAAAVGGILQVFKAEDATAAAQGGNHVVVLGSIATAALGLTAQAPPGSTTTVGNFIVANGANGPETITRGLAAAQALRGT